MEHGLLVTPRDGVEPRAVRDALGAAGLVPRLLPPALAPHFLRVEDEQQRDRAADLLRRSGQFDEVLDVLRRTEPR